ncbi:RcnB family protein [Caulobacter sp. 17J65-9]|uniref:RcnB family protein n=1 Tax=Caulobacter sp. 17J65-9 TaxID=2709382 RepID=UPI0013C6A683|nr:RcnB family protein [Caulobacter sp. 17J65-9]NEX92024.1 hypothetical protein [Caulobacter sp. 17J65-9]
MKKVLSAALALTIASGALGAATTASAHDHGRGHHDRHDDRDYYRDRERADRDYYKSMRKADRAYARAEEARWRAAERRYRAGVYHRPYGYVYRDWRYGDRLPAAYYAPAYRVDYGRYGLYAPPRGYVWTRVDDNAVLTAVATGVIAGVVSGLFE